MQNLNKPLTQQFLRYVTAYNVSVVGPFSYGRVRQIMV